MKKITILDDIRIAHRGLSSSRYPENSVGAFKECVSKNIPIELDIHILKDNTLVVIHDDDTLRMTSKKIILKNASYDDIKDLKLENSIYGIPKLSEVLELVNGNVLLDIELKVDVFNFKICREVCKILDKYNGDFVVKSFNPLYVWWFMKNRPNYIRGLLVSRLRNVHINEFLKIFFFNMPFNFISKPDFFAFDYRDLPNKKIDKLYNSGVPILLFTILGDQVIDYKYTGIIYKGK